MLEDEGVRRILVVRLGQVDTEEVLRVFVVDLDDVRDSGLVEWLLDEVMKTSRSQNGVMNHDLMRISSSCHLCVDPSECPGS